MTDINSDAERLVVFLSGRTIAAEMLTEADWQRIVALSQKQSVAPMLYARLQERGVTPAPAAAQRLRELYRASIIRNTRLFHEVGKIQAALQAAGIPAIPLKGACLAESVYGNIALRPMGDVDLWIRRDQLAAALQVMQSLGYAAHSKTRRPQALQDALSGETQMFKSDTPMVELHWNVFAGEWLRHAARIDEQVIWQRTVPFHGETVRQLAPEDAIIHLCVHLAVNHQMSQTGLRTLLDLEFARRKWVIDWRTVAQRACAWRVSCATWLVLQALAELFGDPDHQLPLPDLAPSPWRQSILRRFVSTPALMAGLNLSSGPRRFLYLLALVDRPADALLLLWRAFFPDRVWLTLRYGLQDVSPWRIWLQRLWHPLSVVLKRAI
ncbi:MAG: nucleotidyltransferase family protein [Chloroflexi bacterium]|nr:nucleotidyltransferase family protein [Chloroflexota bacterium]